MNKLELAKAILGRNTNTSLGGSLMLKIRGIDLCRESGDIDILISDCAPDIIFPKGLKVKKIGTASDGVGAKYEVDGVIVDVLLSGYGFEIYNGLRLGTIHGLMMSKYIYSQKNNEKQKNIKKI